MRVVITGSKGRVAKLLVPRLDDRFDVVLLDSQPPLNDPPEHLQVDICDTDAMQAACAGADAIVHLAGQAAVRATWEDLEVPNVRGLVSTFDAAQRAGVPKLVFASSNHVTGMYDQEQAWPVTPDQPIRPDSLYGATKALGEAIGRFYSDNYGMSVVCVRMGWALEKPHNEEARWMWLSPGDLTRLITGALLSDVRFGIYYGVSNNVQRHWSIDNARRDLSYVPEDDSEPYFATTDSDDG